MIVKQRERVPLKVLNFIHLPNSFLVLTSLFAIPFALGCDVSDSFLFSVLIFLNVSSGAYLYILVSKKFSFFQIELLGIGIGLGTLVPALINFTVRMVGIAFESTALVFPLCMVSIYLVTKVSRKDKEIAVSNNSPIDLVLIFSTPFFALAAWSEDLIYSCLFLALAIQILFLFDRRSNNAPVRKRLVKCSSILVIPMVSFFTRFALSNSSHVPIWRSLIGVDVAVDESTAFGVAKFGIFDNALLAGQRSYGHVLTHLWAGDFATLINSPPFIISASVGLAVGVLGIAALIYSISISFFHNETAARLTLIVVFLQSSMPEEFFFLDTMRMAHSISMMWMVLFCFVLPQIINQKIRFPFVLVILLVFATSYSKVHWGLLAVFLLSINALITFIRSREFSWLLIILIAISVFFLTYKLSFDVGYGFPSNFDYSQGFFTEVAGLVILRFFFLLGVIKLASKLEEWITPMAIIPFALVAHTILAGEYASNYWISFALLWSAIFSGKLLADSFRMQQKFIFARYVPYLLSFGLAAFSCFSFFADNYYLILTNSTSLRSWFIVFYPELIPLVITVGASCIGFLFLALFSVGFRSTGVLKNSISLVVTTIFFVNIGFWLVQTQRITILESHYDIQLSSDLVISDSQLDIGRWLKSNTGGNSILATNFLCDATISLGEPFPQFKKDGCLDRNTLTWLASIGHRRVLIESPVYSGSYIGTNQQIKDYNSSIRFGRDMNSVSGGYLVSRGVDYFVFDLATSSIYGLRDFGSVLYENSDYAVIALNELFE